MGSKKGRGQVIHFNHDATTIMDSFNLKEEERTQINNLFESLIHDKKHASPLWFIQRVWIDETLSDNCKAYLTFVTGRYYEYLNYTSFEGGE